MTDLGMPNSRSLLLALQQVANEVEQESRAAERERLLSMPRLMNGCDALGAPADGEHCKLLRRAILGA